MQFLPTLLCSPWMCKCVSFEHNIDLTLTLIITPDFFILSYLYRIKTRLQVQNKTVSKAQGQEAYTSASNALLSIVKKEGVSGLYAGLSTGLVGTVIQSFSYFYIYSAIRRAWQKRVETISTPMELLLGAGISNLFTRRCGCSLSIYHLAHPNHHYSTTN